jgi:hypothetical protein
MDLLKDIAKKVGHSSTTVSKDIKWLSGEHPKQSTQFFRVVPNLDEPALGLVTIDAFLEISNLEKIKNMERFCDLHPYTKYRARCFGNHSGLSVQFRVPNGKESFIKSLFSRLKSTGYIQNYSILPTIGKDSVFSISRLQHWNSESFTWDFDWAKWSSKKPKKVEKMQGNRVSKAALLTQRDISILTQLSYGARRKQIDIIRALRNEGVSFTSQDFSRSYSLLNESFIANYMIFLDPEAFNLYSNVVLTGKSNKSFVAELAHRMKESPIPFRSTLRVNEEFFFWFLRLPPNHLSSLFEYLLSNVDELNTSLQDYQTSVAYGVWSGAFDDEKNDWNKSREFIIDDPLDELQK